MSKHHHYFQPTTKATTFELMQPHEQQTHPPTNGLVRVNGQVNGDSAIDANDTNNNHNKHQHHHHAHHKRSASTSGESSSSKRTKLNNSHGVPAHHHGNKLNNHAQAGGEHLALGSKENGAASVGAGLMSGAHYNIMEKLKELYRELRGDKTLKDPHLSPSSFLLDKLVTRERLNTLIVNLYPGNKGYSLAFRAPSPAVTAAKTTPQPQPQQQQHSPVTGERETVHETPSWLYDNAHLLDALDAEELPPVLIDFCDAHCPHLYYNGAVIAQVRDYRQSYPLDICDIHYVLLRPTAAALWDEVSGAGDGWSAKERLALEAQLVLATAPPICLDPSPAVGIAAINATTERSPIASCEGVLKMARRFLQTTKNRNNKLEKKTHHPQLALAHHVARHRTREGGSAGKSQATAPHPPTMLTSEESSSSSSSPQPPVTLAKTLPSVPASQRYDWQARNTERLTFETDRDNCQYRVRVELFERPTTCEVSGQLTLERQKGGSGGAVNGRTCPFKLASPLAARRYVKEFMGIFTEEGRKFVKITHERETRAGREIMEMQTGEKQPTVAVQAKVVTPQPPQLQQLIASPSSSITSPPPPALVASTPTPTVPALKLTAAPQRIIAARPSPGGGQQVVVLAQVKQESPGNQVIKNLLNQPRAPMTNSMVNGISMQTTPEMQTVYVQVDNSNLIHVGSAVPAGLQFQQLIMPTQAVTQAGQQTYTMNVQTVTPQQVTVVKRHRDM